MIHTCVYQRWKILRKYQRNDPKVNSKVTITKSNSSKGILIADLEQVCNHWVHTEKCNSANKTMFYANQTSAYHLYWIRPSLNCKYWVIMIKNQFIACFGNNIILLTHYTSKLPSYRKQSIHLQSKSIDWFLYDGNFGVKWVNE